jgi:hypothetical protein
MAQIAVLSGGQRKKESENSGFGGISMIYSETLYSALLRSEVMAWYCNHASSRRTREQETFEL